MSNIAIVGINWGDEGKGRMVDLLTEDMDVVVRYQGGGNAGHTVINEYGKFALHLLPSGIFRKNIVNILGNGVAVDPESLINEIEYLREKGIEVSPANLKISNRASILFPWHKLLDELEENRLKDKKFGSTRQGIAPFYSDKYQKKTLMFGQLFYKEKFYERLKDILEWKNLTIEKVYNHKGYTFEEIVNWVEKYCGQLLPYICDTGEYLSQASLDHKNILFEAQLGALRDLDYGIYPYTTSSNTLSTYAPIGAGAPFINIDSTVGVIKAYSSCVGEGPFVCELFGEEGDKLRELGSEYGAKTGRPRRVGPLDIPATKYGIKLQKANILALTKLDVLSGYDKIPVCVSYQINGKNVDEFPFQDQLEIATPVFEYLEGWNVDISQVRNYEELPTNAKRYIEYVENKLGAKIKYISVGPERESIIIK